MTPRHALPALAGLAVAGLALGAPGCGSWIRASRQRETVEMVRPVELRPRAARPAAEVRAYRVRIHVDADYRAQVKAWRERIPAQLERVNAILGPDLGVRLEAASIVPWERTARAAGLVAAMDELLLADPGDGADWVIGFAGRQRSGGFVDPTGLAPLFSRHMIVTNAEDAEDVAAVNVALDQLTTAEREAAREASRTHQEDVAFLHEWAHTLGAVHECQPSSLMSAQTAVVASGFSEVSLVLARLGLERREARDAPARAAWRERYRAGQAELAEAAFECVRLDQDLAVVRRLAEREPDPALGPLAERAEALVREVALRFRVGERLAEAELPVKAVVVRVELARGKPPRVSREGSTGSPAADAALDRAVAALRAGPEPDAAFAARPDVARVDATLEPAILRTHLRR